MKAAMLYLTPPCAFVIFAFLASHLDSAVDVSKTSSETGIPRAPQSLPTTQDPVEVRAALARLERNVIEGNAVPVEPHDAAGMDRVLDRDAGNATMVGGGMEWISYAREWANEAPEDMFAWLIRQNAVSYARGLSQASILFDVWSEKSMSAALAAVPQLPDPEIRAQALASTLENLYPKDPQRARELLKQNLDLFPPDSDHSPFSGYPNGVTTCEMILALPPSPERTILLASQLSSIAGSSYDGGEELALTVWNGASEAQRRELVAAGFTATLAGLPEMLREHAETSGDRGTVVKFINFHGVKWVEADFPAAFGWSQKYLKGKERVKRGAELFRHAAAKDFDGALIVWKELPEGVLKEEALGAIRRGTPAGREQDLNAVIEGVKIPAANAE